MPIDPISDKNSSNYYIDLDGLIATVGARRATLNYLTGKAFYTNPQYLRWGFFEYCHHK